MTNKLFFIIIFFGLIIGVVGSVTAKNKTNITELNKYKNINTQYAEECKRSQYEITEDNNFVIPKGDHDLGHNIHARVKDEKTYLIDINLGLTYEYNNKDLFDRQKETVGEAKYLYIYNTQWEFDKKITDEYYRFKRRAE